MASCQDVARLVSLGLDTRLSWHRRLRVRLHLLRCRLCSRFRTRMGLLQAAIERYRRDLEGAGPVPAAALSPEARERIKRLLREKTS